MIFGIANVWKATFRFIPVCLIAVGLLAMADLTWAQVPPKCGDISVCAQAAMESAAKAEAAALATRRPPAMSNVTGSRSLGGIYQNTSGRTRVVMVSASKDSGGGNTMFGGIATSTGNLPNGINGGMNGSSVVASSFIAARAVSSLTFIVPDGHFYEVSTDGGNAHLVLWTEADL